MKNSSVNPAFATLFRTPLRKLCEKSQLTLGWRSHLTDLYQILIPNTAGSRK